MVAEQSRPHRCRRGLRCPDVTVPVSSSELGFIRISDVDTTGHTVRAHGSSKHRARRLPLDTWAHRVIYERIAHLTDRGLGPDTIVGSGSLDGTATLIGYQWRQDD